MRLALHNPLRSLIKRVLCSPVLIAVTLCAAPTARSQQTQADKNKPAETKKAAPQKPEARLPGLFDNIKGTFDVGGRFRSIKGDHPAKFEEHRDFPKVFSLRNFSVRFESAYTPYTLRLSGREIGERDQRFGLEAGRVGRLRTRFLFDELPKFYSFGRTFHLQAAPGLLVVNPNLRARLQAVPDAGVAASQLGPTLPALLRQEVQNQAGMNLRVRAARLLFTQSYRPNKDWEFFFRVQRLRRSGTQPKPTGTFAREGTGPAGDGVWETLGMELPEPVQQHTTDFTLGVQYSRPHWRVGLDYHLSLFRNSIPSLTWENPFRVTDAIAVPPGFGVGRNRFARAQLALPPDNDFHSISLRAGLDLPRATQLRGAVTWGRGKQNEPFLPYTLNSALTTANLTTGVPGLFGLAPPQPSLNGVVHTLNQDYALASRPWHDMRFMLHYRSNEADNRSPRLVFPAQPNFGDSSERTAVDFYNLPIENFPTSYTRQNTTGTWQWDARKDLGLELEYDWEVWTRRFLTAPHTNEHSITGRLDYKPWRGVAVRADYQYAHRIPRSYRTQPLTFVQTLQGSPLGGYVATPATVFNRGTPLEFNLLRRFDDDNRIRNNGGVALEVTRSPKVTYSASFRYLRDDHDKNFYGLHYDVLSTAEAEVTYFPKGAEDGDDESAKDGWKENTFFYANYSRDQQQTGYRDLGHLIIGAVQNRTGCCAQFPVANTYDRSSRIHLDTFQIGINTASKGEKTSFDLSYVLSFARDRTHTVNPFPILPISLRTAGAYNYPDVISRQQEVNLSVTRQLRPDLALGFSYLFEPYRLDDYYTNNLQPYAGARLVTDGGAASVPTARQLFLDARYASYHANVATVFLRFTF